MNMTEAVTALMNEEAVYDVKNHLLFIPDVAGDPTRVFGLQIADFTGYTTDELVEIAKEEYSLSNYAFGHFPAPAACGGMDFYPFFEEACTEKEIRENYEAFVESYPYELIPESSYIASL